MPELLTPTDSLFDYFHEQVEAARVDSGVELSDNVTLYLAQLLSEKAHVEPEPSGATTLAELHALAISSAPADKARHYRELGDRALYGLGFFEESVQATIVGTRYYADMGAAAYHSVDAVLKRWFDDAFGPLFGHLADRFSVCVNVLESVRRAQTADEDIERLYSEWLDTGSEATAAKLRRRGLVIPRRPSEET